MSVLLSSTLANPTTPYYALAGAGGGGVTSIVAGTNIAVNQATGAVTVSAPAVIPAVTSTTTLSAPWGAVGAGYPLTPLSGQVAGQTYVAPRTGVYLCQVNMGFNVNPSAIVSGVGDLVSTGLAFNEPFFGIIGSGTLQPLNMPSSGADYGIETSFTVNLTAGVTYTLYWFAVPTSGTLNLGEANGGVSIKIIPLC
jgi:hypothetical protein